MCELADTLPETQCVYMADRESDIYELFLQGDQQTHRADWLPGLVAFSGANKMDNQGLNQSGSDYNEPGTLC